MHPKKQIVCEGCGAAAELEVIPDGFDDVLPGSYTLTRTCSGSCPKAYSPLTAEQASALTGHTWDGATGPWTRLVATSVEGWVP